MRLSENLEETHIFHKKRSFLAMYRLFVLLLLQDLKQGLAGTWAYVVRDIVYTLLRTISSHDSRNILKINGLIRDQRTYIELDNDIFTPSCDLLYQVCKVALSCCPQVCCFFLFQRRILIMPVIPLYTYGYICLYLIVAPWL